MPIAYWMYALIGALLTQTLVLYIRIERLDRRIKVLEKIAGITVAHDNKR